MTTIRQMAYETALLTENAWTDELERVFGSQADYARYDGRNKSTPKLKALYEARRHANEAWHILGKIERNEIAA